MGEWHKAREKDPEIEDDLPGRFEGYKRLTSFGDRDRRGHGIWREEFHGACSIRS